MTDKELVVWLRAVLKDEEYDAGHDISCYEECRCDRLDAQLADTRSKLAVLDIYEVALKDLDEARQGERDVYGDTPQKIRLASMIRMRRQGRVDGLVDAIRLMAMAYHDRPGYSDKWKPQPWLTG